jgi:hypothetical protein
MVSLQKLNPAVSGVRSEESCTHRGGVVAVEVVVEPVVAPVPPVVVPIEVTNVQVLVTVAVAYGMPSVPLPLEYSQGCILFAS